MNKSFIWRHLLIQMGGRMERAWAEVFILNRSGENLLFENVTAESKRDVNEE